MIDVLTAQTETIFSIKSTEVISQGYHYVAKYSYKCAKNVSVLTLKKGFEFRTIFSAIEAYHQSLPSMKTPNLPPVY